jgi:hypothetical protein
MKRLQPYNIAARTNKEHISNIARELWPVAPMIAPIRQEVAKLSKERANPSR